MNDDTEWDESEHVPHSDLRFSSGDEEDSNDDESNGEPFTQGTNNAAELRIEGDFARLVQNIRLDGTSDSIGLLSRSWDNLNEEEQTALDTEVEKRETEFLDDLRTASGIGRKKRTKHSGSRPGPTFSPETNALIGEGNQAYVDGQPAETMRIMREVIRIEPRAASAWSVLAQVHDDMGESGKALQLRIMAAHLRHDAEEWERLARQSRDLGYNQQALYCFGKLHSLDPSNVDTLWDRALLAKECGEMRIARHALLAILKKFPHNMSVLNELRPVLVDLNELTLCASLFQEASDHYQRTFPRGNQQLSSLPDSQPAQGPTSSPTVNVPNPTTPPEFGFMEILVLADLYNTLNQHTKAIHSIRRGVRWTQGRIEQRYWDACDDDREFDPVFVEGEHAEGSARRGGEGGTNGESAGLKAGGFPLDANARHRLAVARIKLGDADEGRMHADIVLSHDVLDYAPLFLEIADAYFEKECFEDAKPIYELLGSDINTSSLHVLLQTAACLRMVGELKEAAEVYEHVRSADPTQNDVKMRLAEIYEILNEPRKALELVYEAEFIQVIDSRKRSKPRRERRSGDSPEDEAETAGDARWQGASLFEERRDEELNKSKKKVKAQNRMSAAQVRELEKTKEAEVARGYRRVNELWGVVFGSGNGEEPDEDLNETPIESSGPARMMQSKEEAEREWLFEAEKLVEMFRETRALFLTTRHHPFRGMFPRQRVQKKMEEGDEERMVSRLHLDLDRDNALRKSRGGGEKPVKVDIFRGVSFDNWLRLFMQYSFAITVRGNAEVAEEVLKHILLSNAYQSRELQDTIRLSIITCALAAGNHGVVVEQCRKLINIHQFNNEPLRILLASLSSGLRPTDAFIASTLQKHLFREMRMSDAVVKNKDVLRWNGPIQRFVLTSNSGSIANSNEALGDAEAGDMRDDEEIVEGEEGTRDEENQKPAIPTKNNPVLVSIYGQICIAAKSYQSAIFYLLHAYDYCKEDPVVCLCLGIASIGRAMQRQSDNRHQLVAQAMAFLSQYREIRSARNENLSEVEYNFGRAFQQIGLYTYAVRHYERVLELNEKRETPNYELAREAAYNLSLIYMTTGATPLAESLYRRWLTI